MPCHNCDHKIREDAESVVIDSRHGPTIRLCVQCYEWDYKGAFGKLSARTRKLYAYEATAFLSRAKPAAGTPGSLRMGNDAK